jgi:SAM-dependent methyltransferase
MKEKKLSREELLLISSNNENMIYIDLGCGSKKKDGYLGVDITQLDGVDIVCDISKGLPFEDNSIDGVYSNFLFEHVNDVIFLFQELYRVCRAGTFIEFIVPSAQSFTQYKDPTHKSIISPETMPYFTKDLWYGSDYNINVDFKVISTKYLYLGIFNGMGRRRYFILRPLFFPIRRFARKYLWNVVHSITFKIETIK